MKILHVVPSLSLLTGGPSKSVPALCDALAKSGHEVVLFSTCWPERNQQSYLRDCMKITDGLQINLFSTVSVALFPNLPYSPSLLEAVAVNYKHFDIVHVHSLWNPIATFAMNRLRRRGMKYCVTPRGMLDPIVFDKRRWKKKLWATVWEQANIEGASFIHFTAQEEARRAHHCNWRINNSIVVPNIIDVDEWKSLPSKSLFERKFPMTQGREIILFVGRINWVKNLDKLLDAFALVHKKRPSAMLVFVGPDNEGYAKVIWKKAEGLGLHKHILFTGMQKGEMLKSAYACGRAFALVSQKENFGLSAAEALASGLPIVLSEGVNMGMEWVANNVVRRVSTLPNDIANAIFTILETTSHGLPNAEAQALASREWGVSSLGRLLDAYESAIA